MKTIMIYFLLFIIYSFLGWIVETIAVFINDKKLINRGFLIGPYCPIYGVCSIVIIIFLKPYYNDYIILFILTTLICSILEYITSYIMEKMFKARWWDYSNIPFNLNGRICLQWAGAFGFGGVLVVIINNHITKFLLNIPNTYLAFLFGITLAVFTIDLVVSFKIIKKLKLATTSIKKDHTGEITDKVKKSLIEKSNQFKRILKAFPDLIIENTNPKKPKKRSKK